MPTLLEDLELDEVSLVDEPANKDARVVLFKRDGTGTRKRGATMYGDDRVGLLRRLAKFLGVRDADLVEKEGDGVDEATRKRFDDLTERLEKLEVDGAGDVAKAIAEAVKSEKPAEQAEALEKRVAELEKDAKIAALEKRLADVEKTGEEDEVLKAFRDELPKALRPGFDEMGEEEKRRFMDKFKKSADSADEPLAKALSTIESLTKAGETASARIEKLEREAEVAKLRTELSGLENFVDLEKTVEEVYELRKLSPKSADSMIERLRAFAKQTESSEFLKEIGSSHGAQPTEVEKRIEAKIEEYRKAHPDATPEQAYAAVVTTNKELYTELRKQEG